MTRISNDSDFGKAIESLDFDKQRIVAGLFVDNVLGLYNDERITRVTDVAMNASASDDELASALQTARAAAWRGPACRSTPKTSAQVTKAISSIKSCLII